MALPKKHFSKRAKPTFGEQAVGLQGRATAQVMDFFSNAAARTGYGTPNLAEGTEYPLVRLTLSYWQLLSMFEGSWLTRRIVELPCQTMVKAWPTVTSDIDPKDITKLDRALRRTNSKAKILTALTWAKLFGGAGCLIAIKDQEDELDQPLDLDSIPVGGFAGLIPFDRWSGIYPSSNVCTDITRPLDFGLPESYRVQAVGGDSFEVHSSRILRFMGPAVPTPEKEAYSSWGISVIEPVLQDIQKYDNISFNILALSFRANILGMKFNDLAQLLAGVGSSQQASMKFEQRMSALNHMISNQSLVPLPADGGIESTSYSFAGLSEVFQQFQLAVSGAAGIPVSRLWGKTISGLGNGTNEGDEKVFEERIANDQDTDMRPPLDKLYPVLAMSELGTVPDDMDLDFPSIRVLDEKEKAELAKTVVDSVTVCLNSGIFSPRTSGKEIKQSSKKTGFGTNLTDEAIDKLSDDVQSEGEMGEGLFGGEGAKTLDPAGSPEAALKETDKLSGNSDEPDPKKPEPAKEGAEDSARATDADDPGQPTTVHGLNVVIETPKGGVRSGPGWEVTLPYDYGYLVGVEGADGDSLDVALGKNSSGWVYLIDQYVKGTKKFDEVKCFIDWPSATAALNAYKAGHSHWQDVLMDWTPMPIDAFKEWIKNGDLKKPASMQ
jgi:phage-related protein (TIGR01555 family)